VGTKDILVRKDKNHNWVDAKVYYIFFRVVLLSYELVFVLTINGKRKLFFEHHPKQDLKLSN
jgi:hypothetical protein